MISAAVDVNNTGKQQGQELSPCPCDIRCVKAHYQVAVCRSLIFWSCTQFSSGDSSVSPARM